MLGWDSTLRAADPMESTSWKQTQGDNSAEDSCPKTPAWLLFIVPINVWSVSLKFVLTFPHGDRLNL